MSAGQLAEEDAECLAVLRRLSAIDIEVGKMAREAAPAALDTTLPLGLPSLRKRTHFRAQLRRAPTRCALALHTHPTIAGVATIATAVATAADTVATAATAFTAYVGADANVANPRRDPCETYSKPRMGMVGYLETSYCTIVRYIFDGCTLPSIYVCEA